MIIEMSNTKTKKAMVGMILGLIAVLIRKRMTRETKLKLHLEHDGSKKEGGKVKAKVDGKFFKKLTKLLKIAIPSLFGRETVVLCLLSVALIVRTILSIHITDVNGQIVKSIVRINFAEFIYRLFSLGLYAFPSSVVNSSLDYFNKLLGLYLRENLTKHFHEKYLKSMCFYQMTNLDMRIANPDQIFTNDIEKWAYSLANLYSNFSKPLLDMVLFSKKLSQQLGYESPIIIIIWYFLAGIFLRYISPPFGHLIALEQSKK
jgi:ATP-binding cassette subfamily D (ALD) protein 3